MKIEIINTPFTANLYGFSGQAAPATHAAVAFALMDRMWQTVKAGGLKNKGINTWVYDKNDSVFAGVELEDTPLPGTGLEHKPVNLPAYAYYKHIGPYHLIKQAGQLMRDQLKKEGFEPGLPYVEIYGHWTNDESKLETELLMALNNFGTTRAGQP